MRLAFVYDRLNKIGGAERVLESLRQIWPQAPFYTAVHDPKLAPFAKNWQVHTSFMQKVPLAKKHHELFAWAMPLAFESFNFTDFDIVISITSAEAKGIITQPQTLHLCYCLTPTRYLWSHMDHYQSQGSQFLRPLKSVAISKLRQWDQVAATRPDHYLSISQTAKKRIQKYYHRDSQIIYPPANTTFFKPATTSHQPPATNYYLIVSRLVSYKHIDLAIKACNHLKTPLIIIGTGKAEKKLKKIAGPTIQFLGQLTDSKVLSYYQHCRALIFPGEEDFGLTMVEAQSVGKPVIAHKSGGAKEIIRPKRTGVFFDTLSVSSLTAALSKFNENQFDSKQIRQYANQFSQKVFKTKFKNTIDHLWQTHQKRLK